MIDAISYRNDAETGPSLTRRSMMKDRRSLFFDMLDDKEMDGEYQSPAIVLHHRRIMRSGISDYHCKWRKVRLVETKDSGCRNDLVQMNRR